jgi:hypothetical protein
MSEVLVKFDEPIMNPRGEMYFAEAVGRLREDDGLWEGWIRFDGIDDASQHIASDRETTQPNRADLEYWAQGLTFVYLQGALSRAKSSARSGIDGRQERPEEH